jgi:hypothetical protein
MSHFVRIEPNRKVNFDDVRDIYIDGENEEFSLTITWAGVEDNIETFTGEMAKKIFSAVELLAINTMNQLAHCQSA